MSSLIGIHTDTMLWLHNKLRNDDNPWSSGGIASQFTNDILLDIYDRFIQLEPKDKIKILLAMLEIPLRNMEGLRESISRIIALAEEDLDEWVRVAANIVRDYPEHFEIDQRLGKVTTHFQQTVHEIVSEIERIQQPVNPNLIPGECLYLNPTALSKVISSPQPPAKHFTLRRKPKSAELRAKITQKATDAANQRRSMHPSGSTSKATLKRTSSLPSGKLPPVQHSKSGLSKALPKKTKVLEYKDQPIGFREQKKRKKAQAMEASQEDTTKGKKKGADSSKQATEKEMEDKDKDISDKRMDEEIYVEHQETENLLQSQDEPGTSTDGGESSAPTTPTFSRDDEKGTSSAAEEEQAPLTPPLKATPSTPSYAILPTTSKDPASLIGASERLNPKNNPPDANEPSNLSTAKTTKKRRRTSSTVNQQQPQVPPAVDEQHNQPTQQQSQPVVQLSHNVNNLINVNPNASVNTQNFQRELQMHVRQEQEMRLKHKQQLQHQQQIQQQNHHRQQQQQHLYNQQQFMQQHIRHGPLPPPFPGPGAMNIPSGMGLPPGATLPGMSLQPPQPHMIGGQQKKGLSLTRDQMLAAQEMFRSANSVTRAEKALILGFMAGARENPFPQQGNVITIKLSEEMIPQGDQHTLVEMLFEMNYETGHWRRLKRTRVMQQGAQPSVNS